jgi:hypothetical protein
MTVEQLRLMDFYQVETLGRLIEEQAKHILRLQAKLAAYEVQKALEIVRK